MFQPLAEHDLVLWGAGHTHAHIVRMWRMHRLARASLTLVTELPWATYSGMLPGTLAGLYPPERMQIDLRRLCASAGVRLVVDRPVGLDLAGRRLNFADRPSLAFDTLSIGIGSTPSLGSLSPAAPGAVVLIKPMQTFLKRLEARLSALGRLEPSGRALRVAVVGAGAGGVEVACCLTPWLRKHWGAGPIAIGLYDRGSQLLPSYPDGVRRLVEGELARRGIALRLAESVVDVDPAGLTFSDGSREDCDLAVWATSAAAPPILSQLGLATDERGFLLTRPTLESCSASGVFAVGDSGTISGQPTPKAGVYAVRQGPVLWQNLGARLAGQPLSEYRPQRGFLSLLATGDGRAILSYRGRAARGRWCWRLKDWIDGRFIDRYQQYPPPPAMPRLAPTTGQVPCAGCGSKLGADVLRRVLAKARLPAHPRVRLGLGQPDDVAWIDAPSGSGVVATADFFTAFDDDPYLVGRVAALHAASDLWASGCRPVAALALVTVPRGLAAKQESLLGELLAGGLRELDAMGAALVGGHTMEGQELSVGFSFLGDPPSGPLRTKAGLEVGDQLVLTKPLGTGALLAANMQARCRAEWYESLVGHLLQSNQPWAEVFSELELTSSTDVTGFGLAGHLREMLEASDCQAELWLDAIELLPGAGELLSAGLESTLAPSNRRAEADLEVSEPLRRRPQFAALFDPQTSGGLLAAVPSALCERLLAAARQRGLPAPQFVGQVTLRTGPEESAGRRLVVRPGSAR